MKERALYPKFHEKMKKADPNAWVYKIPDTFNLGGKKPFDFIVVCKGKPWAIEMKSKGEEPTLYQAYQLTDFVNAGGNSEVFRYGDDMDKLVQKISKGGE